MFWSELCNSQFGDCMSMWTDFVLHHHNSETDTTTCVCDFIPSERSHKHSTASKLSAADVSHRTQQPAVDTKAVGQHATFRGFREKESAKSKATDLLWALNYF